MKLVKFIRNKIGDLKMSLIVSSVDGAFLSADDLNLMYLHQLLKRHYILNLLLKYRAFLIMLFAAKIVFNVFFNQTHSF